MEMAAVDRMEWREERLHGLATLTLSFSLLQNPRRIMVASVSLLFSSDLERRTEMKRNLKQKSLQFHSFCPPLRIFIFRSFSLFLSFSHIHISLFLSLCLLYSCSYFALPTCVVFPLPVLEVSEWPAPRSFHRWLRRRPS